MRKSAIFVSGLLIASMNASANVNSLKSACELLVSEGMNTRKTYQDQYDKFYHCNSDYYPFDTKSVNREGLSNNIAYYVTGPNSSNWNEIKVVANINNPSDITETHKKFREILGKITSELTGKDITFDDNPDTVTDDFFSMVHAGKYNKPIDWFQSGHIATLKIDEWPSNTGFEYRFILKK